LIEYTITPADTAGPFADSIPPALPDQAALEALAYTSALELLAEKFHASPALLARLNRQSTWQAGETIEVPAVTPFDFAKSPAARDGDVSIRVTARDSTLRILDPDGRVVGAAPITSGSVHDPLPPGRWKVTGISWRPPFRYNPELFWDADPSHTAAVIKPGPNNPVGVVWIGINREHYGLHGTPEPSKVGHAESHGCVRLTNWDAARVASLVRVGTPVVFE
jgi:lipoprotein-anchoring transpeptidase ErfK/SrfK